MYHSISVALQSSNSPVDLFMQFSMDSLKGLKLRHGALPHVHLSMLANALGAQLNQAGVFVRARVLLVQKLETDSMGWCLHRSLEKSSRVFSIKED